MKEFFIRSPLKINLTLRITGKNSDGYHSLASGVFKFSGFDVLIFDYRGYGDGMRFFENSVKDIPSSEDQVITRNYPIEGKNILLRALEVLREREPHLPFQKIVLEKIIPPGTGVGGGSGNLAAFLRWINLRYDLILPPHEITALGADVPFLFSPYDCGFLTGIGEKIEPIHGDMEYLVFLSFPSWSSDTRKAYEMLDERERKQELFWSSEAFAREELFSILRKLRKGETCGLFPNDFLKVLPHQEAYESFFSLASSRGSLGWGVSGSGSSMYALFPREKKNVRDVRHFFEGVVAFPWIRKTLCLESW